jgi:hypothetical protein
MICRLSPSEFDSMLNVVNDAAQAYKGVIRGQMEGTLHVSRRA